MITNIITITITKKVSQHLTHRKPLEGSPPAQLPLPYLRVSPIQVEECPLWVDLSSPCGCRSARVGVWASSAATPSGLWAVSLGGHTDPARNASDEALLRCLYLGLARLSCCVYVWD